MEHDGLSGFELIAFAVGGVAAVLVGVVWVGAAVALVVTGEAVDVSFVDAASAVGELPEHWTDPAAAWPAASADGLPGPLVYWASTLVALALAGGIVAGATRVLGGSGVGTARRRVLGVDSKARFACRRDLRPLLLRAAAPGRFVVARFGRHRLVATEAPSRHRARRRRRGARWGNRGAVALVGPSQCGKTTAAVAGILEWDGPAVLSSVKADLMGPTLAWREHLGQVRVYDPTGTTGHRAVVGSWSPIYHAGTVAGAQRAARALCDAAPREGVEGGMDFWLAQAEILLSGLLFVAHHTHQDMRAVADWVLLQDRPVDGDRPGEVRTLLDLLLCGGDEDLASRAAEAAKGVLAVWDMEDRTRSSVYATAQTVVWPWSDPGVAAASCGGGRVDLDWLLANRNTVYLCAPIEDQKRLAPAFGGLLNDLVAQTYRRVAATGKPLDPPLLVVIDEAGNTPLRQLPEYASTLAGIGVLLVTIWQSLAQIEATYGRNSPTILTNHLTKLLYAGLSDASTLQYVSQVLGEAEVETRSRSGERFGRGSIQVGTTSVAMAPVHVVRQMRPGDALLIHGTLPPAHVRTRPYYSEPRLVARTTAAAPRPVAAEQPTQPPGPGHRAPAPTLVAAARAMAARGGDR